MLDSTPQSPTSTSSSNQKIHYEQDLPKKPFHIFPLLTLLLTIALVITSTFTIKYINLKKQVDQSLSITSYEECENFPGSFIQKSEPKVCLLPTGQHFIKPTPPISPEPAPTSTASPSSTLKPSPSPTLTSSPSPSPSSSSYTCPEKNYIDCMPGTDKPDPRCNQEYLNWASVNCPGFLGAVY